MTPQAQTSHSCPGRHAAKLPLVVKYFLVGGLCGFIGTSWSGVHIWLGLNGQIQTVTSLSYHRGLHLMLQLYFFLGLFISGYLLQAGSKLFNLTWKRAYFDAPVFFMQLLSLILIFADPQSVLGRLLFSCSLLLVCLQVSVWWWHSNRASTLQTYFPIATGLVTLALGTQVNLSNPVYALAIIWFGLVPIILASAQQFIQGFLGGTKLSSRATLVPYLCFFVSVPVISGLTDPNHDRLLWHVWSGLGLLVFSIFCYGTGVLSRAWAKRWDIIGLSLLFSIFWFYVGSLSLALLPYPADSVLHSWCIGAAGTLTIATSTRIMGFLARNSFVPERMMLATLWLWQVVAIGRCKIIVLPGWFSWVTGFAATLALGTWVFILLSRAIEIYRAEPPMQTPSKKPNTLKVYQGA